MRRVGSRGIAVGEKGLVRVSNDGGATWTPPEESFPEVFTFMRNIDFDPKGETGMIVGQAGLVLRSNDGGVSWTQVLPPEDRRVGL